MNSISNGYTGESGLSGVDGKVETICFKVYLKPKAAELNAKLDTKKRKSFKEHSKAAWKICRDFCKNSTIHGLKYLGEANLSLSERFWWAIAVLVAFFSCCYYVYHIYRKWDPNSAITPIWTIPFPAVTICPIIKSRKWQFDFNMTIHKFYLPNKLLKKGQNLSNVTLETLEAIIQVCDDRHVISSEFIGDNFTRDDILRRFEDLAPSWEGNATTHERPIFYYCTWQSAAPQCSELFYASLTSEGICYTFNGLNGAELLREDQSVSNTSRKFLDHTKLATEWTLDNGYEGLEREDFPTYPRRAVAAHLTHGLEVHPLVNMSDIDVLCQINMQGYKVFLHTSADVPRTSITSWIHVPVGMDVRILLKPTVFATAPGARHYIPEKRQCYFNHERYLKFYKIYTQSNCKLECLTNITLEKCGCVRFFMPKSNETKYCGLAKRKCYQEAEQTLIALRGRHAIGGGSDETARMQQDTCDCLPECTAINYNFEIMQYSYDHRVLNEQEDFSRENINISSIRIFFKEEEFITSKRSELYGLISFLANCGGVLGLFMGVSLLSIVEILYFFTLRLVRLLRKGKRKKSEENKSKEGWKRRLKGKKIELCFERTFRRIARRKNRVQAVH